MKIIIEAEIHPDPKWCTDGPDGGKTACKYIDQDEWAWCELFRDNNGDPFLLEHEGDDHRCTKLLQCKEAFKKSVILADSKTPVNFV